VNDEFERGDRVEKTGGDYRFSGVCVAAFQKLSGQRRYVVENGDGLLHVFSGAQLSRVAEEGRDESQAKGEEIARLKALTETLAARCAAQSELLSQRAEKQGEGRQR
jgi:hypothetical protein